MGQARRERRSAESRPTGGRDQGPPVLDLGLAARLKGLLLGNSLALITLAVMAWLYATGRIAFRPEAQAGLIPLAVLVGACVLLAACCWFLLPLATWLRAYPRWHFRHGSKLCWAVPYGAGILARLGLRLAAGLGCLAALALVIIGVWRLVELAQGGAP